MTIQTLDKLKRNYVYIHCTYIKVELNRIKLFNLNKKDTSNMIPNTE